MDKIQTNQGGWKFVGGRLCLDFLNTVGGRAGSGAVLRDKLVDYNDLIDWCRFAGIANQTESLRLAQLAGSPKKQAEATLARAILLREALYRTFNSVVEGRPPRQADLEILNREFRAARANQRLTHRTGAFGWTWEDGEHALDRILWPVSLSAADVLNSRD